MNPQAGVRWQIGRRSQLVLLAVLTVAALMAVSVSRANAAERHLTTVLVSAEPHSAHAAAQAVKRLGGHVGRPLPIIRGFAARVPSSHLRALEASRAVRGVTVNRKVTLATTPDELAQAAASLQTVLGGVDAPNNNGPTGAGVDVALLDSGVNPVSYLTGHLAPGVDVSSEAFNPNASPDGYGHGTHLAGIIAGVAPGARIVPVKAAAADGSSSLLQVVAGIGWVVMHRNDPRSGLHIRVLNLSLGEDATGDYTSDAISFAAEQAWKAGIVVVASAGNEGIGNPAGLSLPAADPELLAVGAVDTAGTPGRGDDTVADFSSRGTTTRTPDLVAPGSSIVSLRDPGSWIDVNHPEGLVGTDHFRGSGTSQAAAVVSGVVADLLSARPTLTPDQAKALLVSTAFKLPNQDVTAQGAGEIDLAKALKAAVPANYVQSFAPASLKNVLDQAMTVQGDDVSPDGSRWTASRWTSSRWTSSRWTSSRWTSATWGQ